MSAIHLLEDRDSIQLAPTMDWLQKALGFTTRNKCLTCLTPSGVDVIAFDAKDHVTFSLGNGEAVLAVLPLQPYDTRLGIIRLLKGLALEIVLRSDLHV